MDYKFISEKFAISDDGFHLMRNQFNYKSFKINELSDIWIRKGFDLKNWLFVLCFGVLLISYAIYDVFDILFIVDTNRTIYIERLLVPLLPMLLGIYSAVISLRRANVMIANVAGKRYYFSLKQLDKNDQTKELILHLNELNLRARVDI